MSFLKYLWGISTLLTARGGEKHLDSFSCLCTDTLRPSAQSESHHMTYGFFFISILLSCSHSLFSHHTKVRPHVRLGFICSLWLQSGLWEKTIHKIFLALWLLACIGFYHMASCVIFYVLFELGRNPFCCPSIGSCFLASLLICIELPFCQ